MASSSQAARSFDELLVYLRRPPPDLQRLTFPELFFNPVGQPRRKLSSVERLAIEELTPHLREAYLNGSKDPSPRRCFALLRGEELLFFTVDPERLSVLGSRSTASMGSTPFFVSCDRPALQRLFPTPLWEEIAALNPSEELLIAESSPKEALRFWVQPEKGGEEPLLASLLAFFPDLAAEALLPIRQPSQQISPSSSSSSNWKETASLQDEEVREMTLHTAATVGDLSSLRCLISIRDLDSRNEKGETPLHCALRAGNAEAVDLLASAGARIDLADGRGVIAIELACAISEEMGRFLIWPSNPSSGVTSLSNSAAPLLVDPLVIEQIKQKIDQIKAKFDQTQKEINQILEEIDQNGEKIKQAAKELEETKSEITRNCEQMSQLHQTTSLLLVEMGRVNDEIKSLTQQELPLEGLERLLQLLQLQNNKKTELEKIRLESEQISDRTGEIMAEAQRYGKEIERLERRNKEQLIALKEKELRLDYCKNKIDREWSKLDKLTSTERQKEAAIFLMQMKSLEEEVANHKKEAERISRELAELSVQMDQLRQQRQTKSISPDSVVDNDIFLFLETYEKKSKELSRWSKKISEEAALHKRKAQELKKRRKWLFKNFASFTHAKENELKPRTTASSLLLSPSLLSPPYHLEGLSEAELSRALIGFYNKGDGRSVLLALERLALLALSQRRWVYAAHCLNAARMFAKKEAKNHLIYQMTISDRLERIEAQIASDEWKVILPDSHRGSIDQRREQIFRIRKEVDRMLKRKVSGRHVTVFLSQNISDLIATLIEESMVWLGMDPHSSGFAVGAVGSMARLQMCPCSDIEIFFLLADPSEENIKRFQQLGRAVQMRITNWGETSGIHLKSPRRGDFEGKEATLPQAGLSIDSGLFSLHFPSDHLYGSPEGLAKIQGEEYEDVVIANAMRLTRFVTGNRELINRYQREVTRQLNAADKTGTRQVRHLRAMALMKRDVEEFAPKLEISRLEERGFGIKAELYRLIQSVVAGLALYFGIDESDTFEQIERLQAMHVLSQKGAANLVEVLSLILQIRCIVHSFYGYECDILYRPLDHEEPELFHITDQLASQIVRCYMTLIPLHEAACTFLRDNSIERFSTTSLFDPSIRNSIISNPFSDPDLDEECTQLEKRIGVDPNDVKAHEEYAVTLRAIGRWQDAKKHYEIVVQLRRQKVDREGQSSPEFVDALRQLGQICTDLGQLEEAKATYELAMSSCADGFHNFSLLLADFGRLFSELGDKEQAIDALEKAMALQKAASIKSIDFPRTLYSLGLLLIERGECEAAHAKFEEALDWFARDSSWGVPKYYLEKSALLGSIQMASGKIDEGIKTYELALVRQFRLEGKRNYPEICKILLALVQGYGQVGDEMRSYRYYRLLRSHLIYNYKSFSHPEAVIALRGLSHIEMRSEQVLDPRQTLFEFFSLIRSSPYRDHERASSSSSGAASLSSEDPLLSEFKDEVGQKTTLYPILLLFAMAERAEKESNYRQAALYLGCERFLIQIESDDGPGLRMALDWYCDQLEEKFRISIGATAEIQPSCYQTYISEWREVERSLRKGSAIELLAESTAKQRVLLEKMVGDALLVLGKPPTPFALLGVGSIAQEEMWLDAGAKLIILHPSQSSDYFLRFKNLLEFWTILLGGTEHMDYYLNPKTLLLLRLPGRGFSLQFVSPEAVDPLSCTTHIAGDRKLTERFISTRTWPTQMDLRTPKIDRDPGALFDLWIEPLRRAVAILLLRNSLPFTGIGPGTRALQERALLNSEVAQAIERILEIRIRKYLFGHFMGEAKELDEVDQLLETIYSFVRTRG